MTVSDDNKNKAWKSCHEDFLNTEFAWEWSGLSETDKIRGALSLIGKGTIRESISKMKNGKGAGSSGVM